MRNRARMAAAIVGLATALTLSAGGSAMAAAPAGATTTTTVVPAVNGGPDPVIETDEFGDTVQFASSDDQVQITNADGETMMVPRTAGYHDVDGYLEYKFGVLSTRYGPIPVSYVHYSWSYEWKIKNLIDGGAGATAVVSAVCTKLPTVPVKAACAAVIQVAYQVMKSDINYAISHKTCYALRQAYSINANLMVAYSRQYTRACYK